MTSAYNELLGQEPHAGGCAHPAAKPPGGPEHAFQRAGQIGPTAVKNNEQQHDLDDVARGQSGAHGRKGRVVAGRRSDAPATRTGERCKRPRFKRKSTSKPRRSTSSWIQLFVWRRWVTPRERPKASAKAYWQSVKEGGVGGRFQCSPVVKVRAMPWSSGRSAGMSHPSRRALAGLTIPGHGELPGQAGQGYCVH